jgi:hypothetical protein
MWATPTTRLLGDPPPGSPMFGRGYAMRGRPARARSSRRFWVSVATAAAVGGRAAYDRTTTALHPPRPAPGTGRADHGCAIRPRQATLGEALMNVEQQAQVRGGVFRRPVDAPRPRLTLDDTLLGQVSAVSRGEDLHVHDVAIRVNGVRGNRRIFQQGRPTQPGNTIRRSPASLRGRTPTLATQGRAVLW